MPLLNSYVIWNNKGGVGKTTLTFHMATQYAKRFPNRKILVIDLCPQANVSMALLTSQNARGAMNVFNVFSQKKTISFYLQKFTTPQTRVNPAEYLTNVSQFNRQIPRNIELLCGDMHLELIGRTLEHKRGEDASLEHNPWVFITSSVKYFLEGYKDMQGIANENDWVVFIDTNPSLSVYTEIALVAAERLIIPINADDFSREAIKAMLDLVYGISFHEVDAEFQDAAKRMFCCKANVFNVRRPKIHLLVNNRNTTYNLRSASAFGDIAQSCFEVLSTAYEMHKEYFVPKDPPSIDHYYVDVKDFHTCGVLSLYAGCPLADLRGKIKLFSIEKEAKRKQVDDCVPALDQLVDKL